MTICAAGNPLRAKVSWTARASIASGRSLSDRWGNDVTSWSRLVKVFAEGGDVYENRLVWK
jgi:hypothetical protein